MARRHVGEGECITSTYITSGIAQINIHGPKARDLMQRVSTADLSNEALPFMGAREIDVGYFNLLAPRVPTIHAVQVHDLLTEAGRDPGLRNAGMLYRTCPSAGPLRYRNFQQFPDLIRLPEAVEAFKTALADARAAEDHLRNVLVEGGWLQ